MSYLDGDSLAFRVRCAFGADIETDPDTWEWTDVTEYWHVPDEVTIGWGRSPRASEPETSTLTMTLKNTDGRFSAGHPDSPYWPHIEPWTPISVEVDLGDGEGWRTRFEGYVTRWPTTWPDGSDRLALATISAVGELARQNRGTPPQLSPLYRTITASGPVAYWPAEDGESSTVAGSALSGQPAMSGIGNPTFVGVDDLFVEAFWPFRMGTAKLIDLSNGGTMRGVVQAEPSDVWTVGALAHIGSMDIDGDLVILDVTMALGSFVRWRLIYRQSSLRTQLMAYDSEGAETLVIDDPGVFETAEYYAFSLWQDGATIRAGYMYRPDTDDYVLTGSVAGTLGKVTAVAVNSGRQTATEPIPFGHIAVWRYRPVPIVWFPRDSYGRQIYSPALSWGHEPATDRLRRVAAEVGLSISMPSITEEEALPGRMGAQPIDTTRAILAQCEAADGGLLSEAGFALDYLPRVYRYNRPVRLTLDAAAGHLGEDIAPVYDDQTRNWVRVDRTLGSGAIAEDRDLIRRQGRVPRQVELNLDSDERLDDRANWLLREVAVREPRYDTLSATISSHRELAADWCSVRAGDRIRVINPPPQAGGLGDQLVVGAVETFKGRRRWTVTLNLEPAAPWDVAEADGEQRIAADGSTVAADLSATASVLRLASTGSNGPWTVDPANFPLEMRVGGEMALAALPPVVDEFSRTVSGGFGGGWSVVMGSTAAFGVDGAQGVIGLTGSGRHGATIDVGSADQDVSVLLSVPATATGGTIFHGWMLRYVDTDNHLYLEAQFRIDGRIWLGLYSRVQGVNATLVAPVNVMAYSGGTEYRLDARAVGDVYEARIYSGVAPDWQVSAVAPGSIRGTATGTRALLAGANSNTQPVNVTVDSLIASGSAIGPAVWDSYGRTVVDSWGSPDLGPQWVHFGAASAFRVGSGSGWHLHSAVNTGRHSLIDVGRGDCTFRFAVAAPVAPTGMPLTAYAVARPRPGNPTADQYQVRIAFLTDGRITCTVRKRVAGDPDSKSNVVLDVGYTPGTFWWVQMQVDGATVRGKIWQHGTPEPGAWQTEWTDPDPLSSSWTQIGVTTLTETGSTNTHPVEFPIRGFQVLDPQQVMLAARGLANVQRAWPTGTPVDVWRPAILAL